MQVDSDYVDQLEHFVPMLCANCEAQPVGVYDPTADDIRVLNIICMHALRQHLALAHRISFTSHHLEGMMKATLDTLGRAASSVNIADELYDGMGSTQKLGAAGMTSRRSPAQQPQTDAAAGSAGDGLAVSHQDKTTAHAVTASGPSTQHSARSAASKTHHANGERHVHIADATDMNGISHVVSEQNSDHPAHRDSLDLRSSLASWVETARSKLGLHEDAADRPADKTTDNRGGSESTSEAASVRRESLTGVDNSASEQSDGHWGRGRAVLDSHDSFTSSVFVNIESSHQVAKKLLQDLGRMTKVENLAWCLLNSMCAVCMLHLTQQIVEQQPHGWSSTVSVADLIAALEPCSCCQVAV